MTKKRVLTRGFILVGLVVMSVGIVAAREWQPKYPYGMSPGIREEGLYTMSFPGTYGRLIPILPFPYTKDDGKNGSVSALAAPNATVGGPITIDGKGQIHQSAPPRSSGRLKPSTLTEPSAGFPLVPTGGAASFSDGLESQLRDAIRRINSK